MAKKDEINDQLQVRREKMHALRDAGIDPFGNRFERSDRAEDIHQKYEGQTKEQLEEVETRITVAGRIVAKRGKGKVGFADLKDQTGRIQIYIRKDEVGPEQYQIFKQADLGDFVGVNGVVMKTDMGELSIRVEKLTFLSKALRPLPDKHSGLTNIEQKYRQRYLDLIANQDSFDRLLKRSKVIKAVREYLDGLDFVEVETSMLHNEAGGAAARPFITHHNALDTDFYLRIALELQLKKLIIGGIDRVYELGRVFRNEGIDTKHNPEFTMLETYAAYWDLSDVMLETENLLRFVANKVNGSSKLTFHGDEIDLGPKFKEITMVDAVKEATGIDFSENITTDEAKKLANEHGIPVQDFWQTGHIINEFFDKYVEDTLIQPTFVLAHPIEVSPLAKKDPKDPRFTQRFELYLGKGELANAFSELNDPIDQRERFVEQAKESASGNDEAQQIDEDFVTAMEYGMPPTGGLGIGVDRLTMIMTDAPSIRDVLMFPTLKPEKK
ncbi:lysine--tRNA ligase [Xylocopilactobacillus apicola]|uniref:Lysine--tRNA ligase n=1 Tax=Xylocopilactobacillus apicola TaxID=2932184 RepID=A0AAU9D7P6_9LACO|nr:lysine--tRNA ligase [Xylocopilactobacillus apicola]BDR58340.1 lysine--tRNA ligase [Xylocopilactobacillus apicola]